MIERAESLSCLKNTIIKGWPPNKDAVPNSITLYFCYRDEQTVQDGIILRGERVVIPAATRPYIKVKLHAGHRELTHIYAELDNWYSGLACRAKFDNTWIHAKNAPLTVTNKLLNRYPCTKSLFILSKRLT